MAAKAIELGLAHKTSGFLTSFEGRNSVFYYQIHPRADNTTANTVRQSQPAHFGDHD
jgi:hypothetical protein